MKNLVAVLLFSVALQAETNWPGFRGPLQDGTVPHGANLPLEWSEEKNVIWKTPISGKAWSSPIVWGTQIWLTTASEDGKKLTGICVNKDSGKVLYEKLLFTIGEPQFAHKFNSYASPSPALEEGRAYLHWGSPGTACIDTTNFNTIWSRADLECDHFRGAGSSPYIYKNLLILTMDGADLQYVIALDKNTGKTVWKTERATDFKDLDANGKPKRDGDMRKSYATPIIINVNGKDLLISPGAKAAWAYEPLTGKPVWQFRYQNHSSASRSLFVEDRLYLNSGYSVAELFAVNPDGKGDITETNQIWGTRGSTIPKKPSPIIHEGLLYLCSDSGIATCLDAATGEEVWKARLGGNYSASLIRSGNRIYAFSEDGKGIIFATGKTFKKLGENLLPDGFMSSPAVSGDSLILRTRKHLYRVGVASK
jgi:outer membrane protein assembly factor BamB